MKKGIISMTLAVMCLFSACSNTTENNDSDTDGRSHLTGGWGDAGKTGSSTVDSEIEDLTEQNANNDPMGRPISVSIDDKSIAVIDEDNTLYMWGNNSHGMLGVGNDEDITTPTKIMENVKKVCFSGGDQLSILDLNGNLYTCGWNESGYLGDGTTEDSSTPKLIMENVEDMDYGRAVTSSGELYTWGYNGKGQLGDGTTETRTTPQKVMTNVKKVSTGGTYTLALTTDGTLYGFGMNGAYALDYVGSIPLDTTPTNSKEQNPPS